MTTVQETTSEKLRVETSPKRVRTYLDGHLVADTRRALLVWEIPYFPTYYFPAEDVLAELVEDGTSEAEPGRGEGRTLTVKVGAGTARPSEAAGAAVRYPDAPTEELRTAVRIDWPKMTSWFEEDVEVFTHPRDPHTRVDVLPSSRRIQVSIDGVEVADSTGPRILFETGLPPRYYLPQTHVRMDLLEPSDRTSHCPYKGQARYWTINTGKRKVNGAVWSYPTPLPESEGVAGLVCFLDERVDVVIDGVKQERPRTHFG